MLKLRRITQRPMGATSKLKDKEGFMKAIDGIIDIGEKEGYINKYMSKILRDIIDKMAEKMYHD